VIEMKLKDCFALRADIDSLKGLTVGSKNVLKLLEKNDLKASFYSAMGWEGDLINVLKHRVLRKKKIALPGKEKLVGLKPDYAELLRMLFKPKAFYLHEKELKKIRNEGHELGVHGFIHVKWNALNDEELRKEFVLMTQAFEKVFNEKPESLSTPFEFNNGTVIELVEKFGFKCRSYVGERIFQPIIKGRQARHVMVPVTINKSKSFQPIIEYYLSKGLGKEKTANKITELIEEKVNEERLASFYIHPEFEAIHALPVLEKVLNNVKELGLRSMTFEEVAEKYRKRE